MWLDAQTNQDKDKDKDKDMDNELGAASRNLEFGVDVY